MNRSTATTLFGSLVAVAVCAIHNYGWWQGILVLAIVYCLMPYRYEP